MERRVLGRTGLRVSVFGVGTWQLAGPVTVDGLPDGFPDPGREHAIALIHECRELGINVIDTAPIYGDGEGERRVGEAIRGERDRWIVSTKFGLGRGRDGERIVDPSPGAIRPSLEASLRRLGTDYVDVFLYHCTPDPRSLEDAAAVLQGLKDAGFIRVAGISSGEPEPIEGLLRHGAMDVVQFDRSLLVEPTPVLDLIRHHRLGSIVRGAFARGALLGSRPGSSEDIRSRLPGPDQERIRRLRALVPRGVPFGAFALRYLLDSPDTQTILLGGRTIAQYREALRALDLGSLPAAKLDRIDAIRRAPVKVPYVRRLAGRIRRRLARFVGQER